MRHWLMGAFSVYIGKFYEYSKALLRVRRLPTEVDIIISKLQGGCAGTTAQERNIQVPTQVSREAPSWIAIFLKVRSVSANYMLLPLHGLTHLFSCILLNPEFSGSPVLNDFLFA